MQRIAFFGPSGTFTEAALQRLEGDGAVSSLLGDGPLERVAAESPAASLSMVASGEVDYACVPIESSIDGPVLPTLDPLAKGRRLQIFAETELDISFSILVRPGTVAAEVRTVGAYPVAAAQVRDWLGAHLPQGTIVPASSNAGAAEDLASGIVDAAVSTDIAGQRLGLESLADGVVDVEGARTRFVLVGLPGPTPKRTGSDRTGLYLYLDNNPGSLSQALLQFSIRGVDLTRIASRPTRSGLGNYYFQLDCAGHIEDTAVAEALKELHRTCLEVRYLGSWPVAHSGAAAPPQDAASAQWLDDMKNGSDHL